jgi:hypothetical protein
VVYREAYETDLTPAQQADLLADMEPADERTAARRVPIVIDPSTWARSAHNLAKGLTGPPPGSIAAAYADRFGSAQVVKADNDRLPGAALVSELLRVRGDGQPRLLVSSVCRNLIRTLPALPRDSRNPEDVDTRAEDHAYDALRYGLMHLLGRRKEGAPGGGAGEFVVRGGRASGF